jgi:hypothetical protein
MAALKRAGLLDRLGAQAQERFWCSGHLAIMTDW